MPAAHQPPLLLTHVLYPCI